ncbi:TetR/AcrR family transcriptional regulator [uncultured Dubosiella sp.]|uniref:TetR/AcrR family transcriptional regulator n=1 Tax=uncultured Dubosiella sp. TaxID=1937011 RepID=UPI0025948FBA|nr:TetR/AcrR family transcriptional regulator [uncultured Dubosiella sp.]
MKNQEKQEQIIQTALHLFYERGFKNVSVMDICDACDITKPTFYKYVPSKEEILRHHYRGTLDELSERLRQLDPEPDFWRLIVLGLTFTLRKSVQMGPELYAQYMTLNFKTHTLTARYNSPARDATINSIRKAQENGQIRNMADPVELYLAARNLGLGLALKWCMVRGGYDVVAQTEANLAILFQPNHRRIEQAVADFERARAR